MFLVEAGMALVSVTFGPSAGKEVNHRWTQIDTDFRQTPPALNSFAIQVPHLNASMVENSCLVNLCGFLDASKRNALPLQPGILEIQDEAYSKLCNAQVIQHLAAFMIRDAVDDFRVHNDLSVRD